MLGSSVPVKGLMNEMKTNVYICSVGYIRKIEDNLLKLSSLVRGLLLSFLQLYAALKIYTLKLRALGKTSRLLSVRFEFCYASNLSSSRNIKTVSVPKLFSVITRRKDNSSW